MGYFVINSCNQYSLSNLIILYFFKETIVQAPIEPSNEQPPTSERRMTRFQQSILDRSLQSTSVIG